MRQGSCCRWFGTWGLLLVLSPALIGCVAYPVRNKTILAPGGSGEIADLKRTRKARPATRDLVQKNLGYLDTGVSSATFFWGRWVRQKELNFFAVGAPGAGGGSIGGPVGSGHPVVENLLIAFDNDGNVLQWHVVDDDDLLERMAPMLKRRGLRAGQMPQVPYQCAFFRWDDVTRVKTDPPDRRVRHQDYTLIRMQFFQASDKKTPVCVMDASASSAFGMLNYLISTGHDLR